MRFSVIIPAYNEEKYIAECIMSIKKGSIQPDEIIVADAMSTDHTAQIAAGLGARVVTNEKRHAAGGRNAGLDYAVGDVMVFLDADCIADIDWFKEIKIAFESENIDGLGTYIEPVESINRYENFWGNLSLRILMSFGSEPYYVKNKTLNEAFITASCAYKKTLLKQLGDFSSFFANNAEDIDFCWRALDSGAVLKYVPSAKIKAHSPGDLAGVGRKSFRNGVSSSKLQKVYSNSFINFDKNIYQALFKNIGGVFHNQKDAELFVYELLMHLAGNYVRSLKYHVFNI